MIRAMAEKQTECWRTKSLGQQTLDFGNYVRNLKRDDSRDFVSGATAFLSTSFGGQLPFYARNRICPAGSPTLGANS
jgi:hypothetical protein